MAEIVKIRSTEASNAIEGIVTTSTRIKQYPIDNNFIDCVIQLPSNLFYGTPIATCIMVLKKNKQDNRTLFIDVSKEFEKATNNNKLKDRHIKKL